MAKDLRGTICPSCKWGFMYPVGERQGGFSTGKAAAGAILLGPIGLLGGALGKKKKNYQCEKCGYTKEV